MKRHTQVWTNEEEQLYRRAFKHGSGVRFADRVDRESNEWVFIAKKNGKTGVGRSPYVRFAEDSTNWRLAGVKAVIDLNNKLEEKL